MEAISNNKEAWNVKNLWLGSIELIEVHAKEGLHICILVI